MVWVLRAFGALFIIIPVGALIFSYMKAYSHPYGQANLSDIHVPHFTAGDFPFSHRFDKNNSLPFLGSAIIDIDGDGTPEVFVGGGYTQPDMVVEFNGTDFVDASSMYSASALTCRSTVASAMIKVSVSEEISETSRTRMLAPFLS